MNRYNSHRLIFHPLCLRWRVKIQFTESVLLKEGSDEEKELHKNVKRVMEVIVGLLKDRVDVEKEPAMKQQRVQGFFEKQE